MIQFVGFGKPINLLIKEIEVELVWPCLLDVRLNREGRYFGTMKDSTERSKLEIPADLRKRLDTLKRQEFTIETEKELANIWSEFMERLKESGIDDVEWDHPDFAKERRQAEERVRKEIIRDRELKPS